MCTPPKSDENQNVVKTFADTQRGRSIYPHLGSWKGLHKGKNMVKTPTPFFLSWVNHGFIFTCCTYQFKNQDWMARWTPLKILLPPFVCSLVLCMPIAAISIGQEVEALNESKHCCARIRWKPCFIESIHTMHHTGCFQKWWYPTTIGFPTENDHFGVFWGCHHLRKRPYCSITLLVISWKPCMGFESPQLQAPQKKSHGTGRWWWGVSCLNSILDKAVHQRHVAFPIFCRLTKTGPYGLPYVHV